MTPKSHPAPPQAPRATQGVHTQPLSLKISFKPPAHTSQAGIRAWIQLLDAALDPGPNPSTQPQPNTPEQMWLSQILTLTLGLMHVLRIPYFQSIEVIDCQPSPKDATTWHARIRVPEPHWLPAHIFGGILKTAYALANWGVSADINSPNDRKQFFKTIEKSLGDYFKIIHPRGKSTFEVLRVAHRMGIAFTPLPAGAFQLGHGHRARYLERSTTDGDSALGLRWTQNKAWTAELLHAAGLPGPTHERVDTLTQAQQAAQRIGYPVVVKPADLERGEGVHVDVTPQGIDAAFSTAQKLSLTQTVLVEQQVAGVCHRLFIVRGQLLYAVKRLPIGVYADGLRTVRDLVQAEWLTQQGIPAWKRSGLKPLDDLAHQSLKRQGLQPDAIPAAGAFVALRRIESTAWGGVDEEVTHHIHPDNLAAAIAAAHLFQLEVAGVDFITTDISQPWHTHGGIINEVNYSPLLGGGDISRRYVGEYLSRILENKGRIPIHVFAGEHAHIQAQQAWLQGLEESTPAVLITTNQVVLPNRQPWNMSSKGLYAWSRAVVLSRSVHALILAVETDEFLTTGLPFDHITSLHLTSPCFVSSITGSALDDERNQTMHDLLRQWSLTTTLD